MKTTRAFEWRAFKGFMNPTRLLFLFLVALMGTTNARATADYGPAVDRMLTCAKYYTTGNGKRFVVIHDMEGYYLTGISYLRRCDLNASGNYNVSVSCHYVVNGLKDYASDAERGEISQLVREANYAWHAGCWNRYSTGTEHEGFVSNPAWYTEEMYQASALLHRHLCDKFGIPKDRNHVVAHGQKLVAGWPAWASANLGIDPNCNTHTDPGPYWDWNHYMALLIGGTDNAAFVSKTVADGTQFAPNQTFSCTFTMNNNGTTTWTANGNSGYTLNFNGGTQMGAPTINPISGNVGPGGNASITVNFTAPATPGDYTVTLRMNNSSGAFYGQSVSLTVHIAPFGPTINPQPVSQTVNPGANVTFTVGATGSGAISYQWRKNNVSLANGGKIYGVNTASLVITNVQQTEVGNYSVAVTDSIGTTTSANAALAVNTVVAFDENFEAGNLNNWAIAISSSTTGATTWDISTAQNHTPGGNKSAYVNNSNDRMYRNIGVTVAGRGRATFWIYDSTQTREFAEVRSYVGGQFTYDNANLKQLLAAGKYSSVTMPGEDGSVAYVNSHYQGRLTYAGTNGNATGWFNLNAPGAPGRSTGWHKFEIVREADSSTIKWYVDDILSRTFTGVYSPGWDSVVIGSTGTGSTVADAWLDDLKVEYYDPPSITAQPASRTNVVGTTATFTMVAYGTVNTFQWRKDGTNLVNGGNISGATSPTLTINNVQVADAAAYDIFLSNGAGPANSAIAMLKIAPTVVTPPAASTNLPGSTATFTVIANGQPNLNYQWRCNGTNLTDGARVSGVTTDTLTLSLVHQDDEGSYSVIVDNGVGTATSTAAPLVVLDPPFIVTPPADQLVNLGTNVTFTVVASGTPPLFYQWRFNDTNIAGATASSYAIPVVQLADSGGYSVEVTNAVDTVISLEGVLSLITPPPQILSSEAAGGMFTLTWNALGGKTYRVQFKDSLDDTNWSDLLPDVTASGPTASKSDPLGPDRRFYRILTLD